MKKNKKIVLEFAPHQYSEAVVTTLLNYLKNKEIIDLKDYWKFYEKALPDILNQIIERDKEENNE